MINKPTPPPATPAAPAATPPGAPRGPQFGKMYEQWSQMPTPDPKSLLQTLWNSGILSEMQKEMIAALIQNPAGQEAPVPMGDNAPPSTPAAPPTRIPGV